MSTPDAPVTSPLSTFYAGAAHALVRAEHAGHVPPRFTGDGAKRWAQFANELTDADRLDLAIQDAAAAYPTPFGLRADLPGYDNGDLGLMPDAARGLIEEAISTVDASADDYLRAQAQRLGIQLTSEPALSALPAPEAHHTILELPGTAGWLTYHIARRPDSRVYLWENFTIACASWQEVMLAGLIAFELNAPPHKQLPIVQEDEFLLEVLGDKRYDWIVGARAEHAHRTLETYVRDAGRVVLV